MSRLARLFRRRSQPLVAAAALGSLALAMSSTATLSSFTAQITNSGNTAATGMIAMKETLLDSSGNATTTTCSSNDGTAASVSSNSATCSSINKYGGTTLGLTPGGAAQTTKISITNTGNVAASTFTLAPGSCSATSQTPAGTASLSTVCAMFTITITSGSTTIYSGAASSMPSSIDLLGKLGTSSVAAGASIPFTFSVQLSSSATNAYAGFVISQSLAWTFTA